MIDILIEKIGLELIDSNKVLAGYILENNVKAEEIFLPISIFRNGLSTLEIISKYLKENCKLKINNIALLLNRKSKTIYGAYYRSVKKNEKLDLTESRIKIPLSIFYSRKMSLLENLVYFLKKEYELRNNQIGLLLNLRQTTISCINHNIKKKNEI